MKLLLNWNSEHLGKRILGDESNAFAAAPAGVQTDLLEMPCRYKTQGVKK